MSKPTDLELRRALSAASFLRENGTDSRHLAKSLLYLQHRTAMLEKVFDLAERYVHGGHDQLLHAELVRAIEFARKEEAREKHESPRSLGL